MKGDAIITDSYKETTEYSVSMPKRGRKRQPIIIEEHFEPDRQAMQEGLRMVKAFIGARREANEDAPCQQLESQQANSSQADDYDTYKVQTLEEAMQLAKKLREDMARARLPTRAGGLSKNPEDRAKRKGRKNE